MNRANRKTVIVLIAVAFSILVGSQALRLYPKSFLSIVHPELELGRFTLPGGQELVVTAEDYYHDYVVRANIRNPPLGTPRSKFIAYMGFEQFPPTLQLHHQDDVYWLTTTHDPHQVLHVMDFRPTVNRDPMDPMQYIRSVDPAAHIINQRTRIGLDRLTAMK